MRPFHRSGVGLLLGMLGLVMGCSGGGGESPNIILITLDTTRADRLSFSGYRRETSPYLDRLAAQSVVYSNAYSTASSTLPAHASLFTGKLVSSHGARRDAEGPLRLLDAIGGPEHWDSYRARGLSPDETTLASLLAEAGYATGAVVAGPWLKRIFGLDAGFEFYDDSEIGSVNGRRAEQVTDSAIAWLEGRRSNKFFLFLNYFDAHAPYMPPEEAVRELLAGERRDRPWTDLEMLNAQYDAEIRHMDHEIGRLFRKLQTWGLYDDAWILVTADHGELLGEHGKNGHGLYLHEEEIRIPLVLKYPSSERAGDRHDARVQLTAILPLICSRLGLPVPPGIQGSVPAAFTSPIVAETYPHEQLSPDGHWRAYLQADAKFLWNSRGHHQLFDLAVDPREARNLVSEKPELAAKLHGELNAYLSRLPEPGQAGPAVQIDPETAEALESLGYIK